MGKTGRAHIFHTLGKRGLALVRSTLYSYFASKTMVICSPKYPTQQILLNKVPGKKTQ